MRLTAFVVVLLSNTLCSTFAQGRLYMQIASDIQFLVTDPLGRQTGVDTRYSKPIKQWKRFEQIPNATFGDENSNEGGPSVVLFESFLQLPESEGTYTIELIGDSSRVAFLTAYVLPWDTAAHLQHPYFHVKKIPIDKDSSVTYHFTYHAAQGRPVGFAKAVSASSLARDISSMRGLNWIKSTLTSGKYLSFINTFRKHVARNNLAAARRTLLQLSQNVASDSASALTADACQLLRADVDMLLRQY